MRLQFMRLATYERRVPDSLCSPLIRCRMQGKKTDSCKVRTEVLNLSPGENSAQISWNPWVLPLFNIPNVMTRHFSDGQHGDKSNDFFRKSNLMVTLKSKNHCISALCNFVGRTYLMVTLKSINHCISALCNLVGRTYPMVTLKSNNPGGGGGLPYKSLMGMCRGVGSHFHDWSDYNGVAFSIELLEWGRKFSNFGGK